MRRARRPLAALALIAIVALLSACGSNAPPASGNSDAIATIHRQALRFAECMRANGVTGFPDPSGSGNLTIDQVANGSSVNTSTPAWRRAITACKALEPSGFTGSKRSPQQQAAARRFAQCVRNNGVPDFPDPTPDSPLVDTNRIPSANQPGGMALLHAAMEKCRGMAAAAGVTR